ncbi:hypothetical protein [Altericista sp. CCNU0014]|uniref:hypothetical protein n=1 Tax=Altericista sp. CCNU0014 TaxID=3082949 RepID=UPI003850FB36
MTSFRLAILILCSLCVGYAAACIPGLQLPLAVHRWHPPTAIAIAAAPVPV